MILRAPGKVNLYLGVIRKMKLGYHEIETIFARINLFDEITIVKTLSPTKITCSDRSIPAGPAGLVFKTIEAYRRKTGVKDDYRVKIKKNIPVGGGLGGGSSDAASILMGINKINGNRLKSEELMKLGAGLGADIPFFLSGACFASGKGRGDIIKEINKRAKIWHILVTPPVQISTKEIYSKVSRFNLTKRNGVVKMKNVFYKPDITKGVAVNLHNDLQPVVLREFPFMEKIFSELKKAGAMGTLLAGSGATIFGIFRRKDIPGAKRALKAVFPAVKGWRISVARTL